MLSIIAFRLGPLLEMIAACSSEVSRESAFVQASDVRNIGDTSGVRVEETGAARIVARVRAGATSGESACGRLRPGARTIAPRHHALGWRTEATSVGGTVRRPREGGDQPRRTRPNHRGQDAPVLFALFQKIPAREAAPARPPASRCYAFCTISYIVCFRAQGIPGRPR